jgi:hypothetical protein
MPMICSVQLLANRDAKAAAEEDSLQIVKIVMIYFFTPPRTHGQVIHVPLHLPVPVVIHIQLFSLAIYVPKYSYFHLSLFLFTQKICVLEHEVSTEVP